MVKNMVPVSDVDKASLFSPHHRFFGVKVWSAHSGMHLDFKFLLVDGVQPFLVALVLLSRHEDDVLAFVVAMERALVS